MTHVIHELEDRPRVHWDQGKIIPLLSAVRLRQRRLIRRMKNLGFHLQEDAILQTLTQASLARRLGMDVGALVPADRTVEGTVEMMLNATQIYAEPLTEERLFGGRLYSRLGAAG